MVAGGLGYAPTDVEFFALTGLGDGAGVLAGHTAFYALKVPSASEAPYYFLYFLSSYLR